MVPVLRPACLALAFAWLAPLAAAQCPDWSTDFTGVGANAPVYASAVFDDGSGPALFVGGDFTHAAGTDASRIASWDGTSFTALGLGVDGAVHAIAVHDDGGGPALFVGGAFTTAGGAAAVRLAKWDGAQWSEVGGGLGGTVYALASFDDGTGPALYASGAFTSAGAIPAAGIARWDGTSWSAVSSGLAGASPVGFDLAVWDDGGGAALYVGGFFDSAGGVAASSIAKWNGSAFSALSGGVTNYVAALSVFDDGSGPRLYAGGSFHAAGGVPAANVARWDGLGWSAAGAGLPIVESLAVVDVGTGGALYAGLSGGGVRRWIGSTWAVLGASFSQPVHTITAFDEGLGTELYAGGNFSSVPVPPSATLRVDHLARWNGSQWAGVGPDDGLGQIQIPTALATWQTPGGARELVAGGGFTTVGGFSAKRVARWNGTDWAPLGLGIDGTFAGTGVSALAEWNDGTGNALYAAGYFASAGGAPATSIAKWDGASWSALGSGILRGGSPGNVNALVVFDDGSGPALYAAGYFDAAGGVPVRNLARWNGASWSDVGGGVACGGCSDPNSVYLGAAGVFDDGGGPALYVGGRFFLAGAVPATNIAKWDGTSWSALGIGVGSNFLGSQVSAFAAHDDGSGPALYVGGQLTHAGVVEAEKVARWDGRQWSAVGAGLEFADGGGGGVVRDLVVHDDGSGAGPALFATGAFHYSGGQSVRHVARWNGASWTPLSTGLSNAGSASSGGGTALAVYDEGSGVGPSLYVTGEFLYAGSISSSRIARWKGCGVGAISYCAGDGLDPAVTTSCPCANFGDSGRGCANSVVAAGALLEASGTTAIDPSTGTDTIVLAASGMPATALAIFLQGTLAVPQGLVFGDGVRCTGGALIRLAVRTAVGGGAQYPLPGEPSLSERGGVYPGLGATRNYQVYYRDGPAFFCPPATFNITNGLAVYW